CVDAGAALAEAERAGRLPILVGGTGLYLRTLLDGIAPVPPIDPAIRQAVRDSAVEDNRVRLEQLDPDIAARLRPTDKTRIARALEVRLSTGQSLSHWQDRREGGIETAIALRALVLLPPRDWLYGRCDERFAAMVEGGAVDEVKALLGRGLSPSLPVMRAIGVRELAAYLDGRMPLAEAIAAGQQATRNYAKRQFTWFAHQPPADWQQFRDPLDEQGMSGALETLGARS
ncbi:MAG: tRNA (adenosine(37)-N6)-dimethylallyltransferase MiaA, partial [Sphingomicrobium sp.]